ncbi:MAG: hypothetical protein L0H64_11895 [Pseudonocardia sp.]|nr:hypothetical protein [Pseudonocardia sp.]
MNTPLRLGAHAAALALVFGAAWGVGTTAPVPVATGALAHDADGDVGAAPRGLTATAAGYTLTPQVSSLAPGRPGEYSFTVTGPDGRSVTAYDRPLRLVVVRRDAAGFQHLHPDRGPDGVWRVRLTLPAGGVYRVYVDIVPTGGPALVLGADLFAPGDFTPIPLPPSRVAHVDGYRVRLDGDLVPGRDAQVFATVTRGGVPVTDLEPHLGAFGHLVSLRRSDLAYLQVRPAAPPPQPGDRSGPGIAFVTEVPSAGGYRLFLEFRHGGVVRTAEFTVGTS